MLDKRELNNGKLYADRGMKKWQGLILSEHNEVLKQIHKEYNYEYQAPVQQEAHEIDATITSAFLHHYKVWIAINQVNENGIYKELEGNIQGYDGDFLIIDTHRVRLDLIRCVEFVDRSKFWQQ